MKEEIKQLKKIQAAGKLGHAYLFHGEDPELSFDTALEFAAFLLGEEGKEGLKKNVNFNLVSKSEDDEEIKIKQIRALKDFLSLSALGSSYKVSVIKDAEEMNRNAANALLKALEEPSKGKIVLMSTKNHELLLPTIISRVEKIGVLTKKVKNVKVTETRFKDFKKILNSGTSEKFNLVEKIAKKDDLIAILEDWISFSHDIFYVKSDCLNLIKNSSFSDDTKAFSEQYEKKELEKIIKEILKTLELLKNTNTNSRLALENLVLSISNS